MDRYYQTIEAYNLKISNTNWHQFKLRKELKRKLADYEEGYRVYSS